MTTLPWPGPDGLGPAGRHTLAELLFRRLTQGPDDEIALFGRDRAGHQFRGLRASLVALARYDQKNRAALRLGRFAPRRPS